MSNTQSSIATNTEESEAAERQRYLQLHCSLSEQDSGANEQLRTAPLISFDVKSKMSGRHSAFFPQYGFLGCQITSILQRNKCNSEKSPDPAFPNPVLLNVNTPWSVFLCGSQGSGKSYTLSCVLEACLHPSPNIGKLQEPLAGVVFHYDTNGIGSVCEAAHLASLGIRINVLVSRSNFRFLHQAYAKSIRQAENLQIREFMLQPRHLDVERMYRLMAFSDQDGQVPLYMEVIMRILRDMAITSEAFDYDKFKQSLDEESLQPGQRVMMNMRLNLLESFLDMSSVSQTSKKKGALDIFAPQPGTLTIVDLSDPFLDASTACTLFDIALSRFEQHRPSVGTVVALDEAHKFMIESAAAEKFTEHLLTTIREQRHNATRVVISTQEPTISPKLLDLCTITFVHRFSSPDWLAMLRRHLAAASALATTVAVGGNNEANFAAMLFAGINELNPGESLLFAPSAMLKLAEGVPKKLGTEVVKFKTRKRLGDDGGRSMLTIRDQVHESSHS